MATNVLVNYEQVQAENHAEKVHAHTLINTLPLKEQQCLISNTLSTNAEMEYINECIRVGTQHSAHILLYGKNCTDKSVFAKYEQLISLGFSKQRVKIYGGGLFEWLLLQDIYGEDLFPTTSKELDLLKFK